MRAFLTLIDEKNREFDNKKLAKPFSEKYSAQEFQQKNKTEIQKNYKPFKLR